MQRLVTRWLIAGLAFCGLAFAALACGFPSGSEDGVGPDQSSGRALSSGSTAGSQDDQGYGVTNANLRDAANAPEQYLQARADVTGEVFGIQQRSTGATALLFRADSRDKTATVYVEPHASHPAVPLGSTVRARGTITHFETVQAIDGGKVNIPYVVADGLEVILMPDGSVPTAPTAAPQQPSPTPTLAASPEPTETPATSPIVTPTSTETPAMLPTTTPTSAETPTTQEPTGAPASPPTAVAEPAETPTAMPSAMPAGPNPDLPALTPVATTVASPLATATPTAVPTPLPATPSPPATSSPVPTRSPEGDAASPRLELHADPSGTRSVRFEVEDMAPDANLAAGDDPDASGGTFVGAASTDQNWDGVGSPPATGEARVTVSVPEDGRYAVWVRMRYSHLEANSVWLRVDESSAIKVGNEDGGYGRWKWVGWQDGNTDRRITLELDRGEHEITLIGRERGAAVDAVLLTSDLDARPEE